MLASFNLQKVAARSLHLSDKRKNISGTIASPSVATIRDSAFGGDTSVINQLTLGGSTNADRGMEDPALRLVQNHFQQFGNAYATSFLQAVPEPAASSVLMIGAAALLRRRQRLFSL